ncbi:uncharacterized protein T551_01870 [Pneumocystis jirovecii RU7]|uniref:Glutamate-rich WD repeat-containing protein 1 n=1 Tax=Pneumocystis jirovecii (strain RU7) TaxID=1408657 RepID=A0A0W4ZNL7_PNEJ7|nr:uncharacterized protein T551_01870 [Pneumocystis jirovecii RU7]KTW29926.1 hypothetical protein T551_01870 [Pneumocystis jirovecii RU7]
MHKRKGSGSFKENEFSKTFSKDTTKESDNSIGEFEDPWEDEIESEQEYIEDNEANIDLFHDKTNVYLPSSRSLKEDEILEPDQSAYEMLHSISVQWPCLSFDILEDNLGIERTRYPVTMYLVSGSQADTKKNNVINVIKLSHLCKTQYNENSSIDSNDSIIDEDPILEYRSLPTFGTTNCIRAFSRNENYFTASFSETGKVHIWNITPHISSINNPGTCIAKENNFPIYTISNHKTEGYAINWNTLSSYNFLISGDNNGYIYLTSLSETSWFTEKTPFLGHTSSVEDLAWSPSEKNVFASASSDGTIKIWDIRNKEHKPALSVNIYTNVDINVISWNKNVSYLMASGADDGKFNIWDLRTFQSSSTPSSIASFSWHSAPITSIEWHPLEKSVISVSDNSHVSLWDLSVEIDDEDQFTKEAEGLDHIPSQLMFIHMGGKDIKETHWHPQIPGCLISTSSIGIQIFKTISI